MVAPDAFCLDIEEDDGMEALKELLPYIWDWLVANPPWLIGIVATIAVLLWWVLHVIPDKKKTQEIDFLTLQGQKNRLEQELNRCTQSTEDHAKKLLAAETEIRHWRHKYEVLAAEKEAALLQEQKRKAAANETAKVKLEDDERAQGERQKIGEWFESQVIRHLYKAFCTEINSGEMKLLHSVRFAEDTWQNQIDILLLHKSGIYVIECKYWDGYVLGRFGWGKWLKITCDMTDTAAPINTSENPPRCAAFANPIAQTSGQKEAIKAFISENKDLLTNEPYQYVRLIVMGDKANLSFENVDELRGNDKYMWVGNKKGLIYAIKERMGLALPPNAGKGRLGVLPEASKLPQRDVLAIYHLCKDKLFHKPIDYSTL